MSEKHRIFKLRKKKFS